MQPSLTENVGHEAHPSYLIVSARTVMRCIPTAGVMIKIDYPITMKSNLHNAA